MADNKITMPSGMGGLVRYFDDYKSKLAFTPEILVAILILVVVAEILLHAL